MKAQVKVINLFLIFLTVGGVLALRMETAKLSYKIAKDFEVLKVNESEARLLSARYEYKVGSERMVSEAQGMIALDSPSSKQVVMVDRAGLAITR